VASPTRGAVMSLCVALQGSRRSSLHAGAALVFLPLRHPTWRNRPIELVDSPEFPAYTTLNGFGCFIDFVCQHPHNVWSLHGLHECLTRLHKDAEAKIIIHGLR